MVFCVVILMLLLLNGCGASARPNVLIITVDTLRADHLGCYGFGLAHTPNIDALAGEGVRCTDAAATAPITLPSHCSIMTGLYPPTHGVRDNGAYALGNDTVTLADRLRAAGYSTKAIVSAVVLSRRYNLSKGFDDYDDDLWAEDEPKLFLVRDRKAAKTAARFVAWLDRWDKHLSPKPFFAWVHFYDPHAPYEPPARFRPLAPSLYDGEIAAADAGVGTIIAAHTEKRLLDRTLVVLTADHGESLGEHGERTHALFIYDATIHVPLIWRYPRLLPAGRTYDAPVSSVDIVPTVLAALGLPGGEATQGVSLLGALEGISRAPAHPQYCESLLSEVGFGMAPLHGVRMDGMKWIRAPKPELYDLRRDPKELDNLYARQPEAAKRLDQVLEAILTESKEHQHTTRENPMDKETLQALRSLGYIAGGQERASMGGMDPKDGIGIYNQLEDARHDCQEHRWKEAEGQLRQIIAKVPTHLTARNILALVLQHEGHVAEAKAEYERSLQQDPKQSRVWGILSVIEMGDNNLDQAEADLDRALAITPHFVEAICNRGFVAALRGDEATAQQWYERAIAEDPEFPRVWRRIADLYYEKGDYRAALRYYDRTLRQTRDDFAALIQSGNCERHLRAPERAASFFERAARLRSDSFVPAYNLGCLAVASGKPQAGLADLATAVAKGFHDAETLRRDADWDAVRTDPTFVRIAHEIERAAASARGDQPADEAGP